MSEPDSVARSDGRRRPTGMTTALIHHDHRHARVTALVVTIVLAAGLASATGAVVAGDDDQRIEFAPGTDSGSVSGTFREGEVDNFTLRAAAGQTMFVSVDPADAGASVAVFAPGGSKIAESPEPGADFSVVLPVTGDYLITVGPGRAEVTAYTLTVRIPPLAPLATTTPPASTSPPPPDGASRVEFAPGTDRAVLRGSLVDDLTDRYVLRAAAGQSMTLTPVAPLHVSVTAPDGSPLPGGPAETITFQLPLSGDYVVEILPGMSEQTAYSITVIITAGAAAPAGVLPPTL
jgi:hypothetical protein